MATIAIIGALEKEIMQIKEELSNVCMVQEAGLNVVTGGLDGGYGHGKRCRRNTAPH